MKVICISGKAGHGKDTVAELLADELKANGKSVMVTHYADLLKYVCKTFFGWDGVKDEKGRELLQYVGTDKVRAVSPDYWANFVVSILSFFGNSWDYVLIPDTRFPNEYEIYRAFGMDAMLVRVVRPGYVSALTEEQRQHPSETALDHYPTDVFFVNDGELQDLRRQSNSTALVTRIPCRSPSLIVCIISISR